MTQQNEIYFEMIDRNKAREYEKKKNKQNKEYTLEELKVSHHNFMIDHKIKVLMNKLKS